MMLALLTNGFAESPVALRALTISKHRALCWCQTQATLFHSHLDQEVSLRKSMRSTAWRRYLTFVSCSSSSAST